MSNATSPMSLAVGDRVVYPNQGLCRVVGIDEKEVAGQRLSFVSLTREEDGARVMVPRAKVEAIGVRKVAGADEVQKIFAFLRSDSDKASLDWKARARSNVERMSTGGLQGLAEVVKGLQVLSELRPLPTKERELYDDARHLLVTEIAAALTIASCDAEDAVDAVLFIPGKERPRRTAEEFKALAGGDDLELGDDLLGLEGEDAAVSEPSDEPEEAAEGEDAADGEETDEKPKAKKGAKARGKDKPREKAEAPPKKIVLSDFEVTEPLAEALRLELPLPRKRGRPPKARPALPAQKVEAPVAARPLVPKMAPIEVEKPHEKSHAKPAHPPAHAPAPAQAAHAAPARHKAEAKAAPRAESKKAAKVAAKPKEKKAPAKGKKK